MQSWGLFQTRVCWTMSPPSQETRLSNKARVIHPQFSPLGLAYHQYLRKLVTHIQAGEFMDMAELLPDRMGITSTPSFLSDKYEKQPFKTKRRQVMNITEWVQCYSIYVAVLTFKYPDKIQDLMGYQALIIEACLEYINTKTGNDNRQQ